MARARRCPLNEHQIAGLRTVVPAAVAAEAALFLPRAFTIVSIAQCIAESATRSGWWTSRLYRVKNNPFGIKLGHRQGADYGHFDAATWEIVDGKKIEVIAEFQTFPNLREAFIAHAALLLRPMYRPALDASRDAGQSLEWQVRNCAERLGPKVPACLVHGIPTVADASGGKEFKPYPGSACPVCNLALSPGCDRIHCGYCTNPNYGRLLWSLVEECGLLDPARLDELRGKPAPLTVTDVEMAT